MPKEKVRPIHEIRFGRIKAAIWENETQNGMMFNVNHRSDSQPHCTMKCIALGRTRIIANAINVNHSLLSVAGYDFFNTVGKRNRGRGVRGAFSFGWL